MSQDSLDDLFERNADMRLLERRHREIGISTNDGAAHRVGSRFGAESIVPDATADFAREDAPLMRVEIAAAPRSGVIPGAVLGVAVDVHNDGSAPAPEAILQLSLPMESQFREGSLRLDGREVAAPERLFAAGLPIPGLPGAAASKVTFQLQVLPGLSAIILQPRLQATGVPVVGTVGISIIRGAIAPTALPTQPPQRPFYELEEGELDEVHASGAKQPILPPLVVDDQPARLKAAPLKAPPKAPKVSKSSVEMAPVVLEPEPTVEAVPAPSAPSAEGPAVRYRSIGSAEVALLERLFAVDAPGPIAHLMTISLLACTQSAAGDDVGNFDAAVRHNGTTLGRALVLQRLGKPTTFLVAQSQLDELAADAEPGFATPPPGPMLRRSARDNDGTAIATLLRTSDRDVTVRFHLALLVIGAEAIGGLASGALAADVANVLVAYRANAVAWLGPACVASAGRPGNALPDPPTALDAAGRRLLSTLKAALP